MFLVSRKSSAFDGRFSYSIINRAAFASLCVSISDIERFCARSFIAYLTFKNK